MATLNVLCIAVVVIGTAVAIKIVSAKTELSLRPGYLDIYKGDWVSNKRLQEIAALERPDRASSVRLLEAGERGLDRNDVELLRQDRRSARAYYPQEPSSRLFEGAWMPFSSSTNVPEGLAGPDHSSTLTKRGWVLDGPAFMEVVRADHPGRASGAATQDYFSRLRD